MKISDAAKLIGVIARTVHFPVNRCLTNLIKECIL